MSGDELSELRALASECGIVDGYHDVEGRWHEAGVESTIAVLRALGHDIDRPADAPDARRSRNAERQARVLPPVLVAWDGHLDLPSPDAVLHLEQGSTVEWSQVERPLPFGVHRLHAGGVDDGTFVISAPWRGAAGPPGLLRDRAQGGTWGIFVSLAGVQSARNDGIGDVTDLVAAAHSVAPSGARVLGILPVLAGFVAPPTVVSPYSPVSRRAWNELVVDLERAVADTASASGRSAMRDPVFRSARRRVRAEPLVDVTGAGELKRAVIEAIAADSSSDAQTSVQRFVDRLPHIGRYARFRAAGERHGRSWREWPDAMRDGCIRAEDVDPTAERYHRFAQWLAHEQLVDTVADLRGDGQVLALDLALGVHPDGFDVWDDPRRYAHGVSAGAPPDAFFRAGQTWGFAPLHPERSRADAHAALRDALAHHFRVASMLRIDHVMHLHRTFWVPDGFDACDGVYVRSPADELWAVCCLEAHRAGAMIVGENLGTVPDEVNDAMSAHGARGLYVGMFNVHDGTPPLFAGAPYDSIASWSTHDLPTFAGWWSERDLDERHDLGYLEGDTESAARDDRARTRSALARRAGRPDDDPLQAAAAFDAVLADLSACPAAVVVLDVADCFGETESHNVPGTDAERPNWRHKLPVAVEDWQEHPGFAARVGLLRSARG